MSQTTKTSTAVDVITPKSLVTTSTLNNISNYHRNSYVVSPPAYPDNPLGTSRVFTKPLETPSTTYRLGLDDNDYRDTYVNVANGPRSTRYHTENVGTKREIVCSEREVVYPKERRESVKIRTALGGEGGDGIDCGRVSPIFSGQDLSDLPPPAGKPSCNKNGSPQSGVGFFPPSPSLNNPGRDRSYTNSTSDILFPCSAKPPANKKDTDLITPSKKGRPEHCSDIRATEAKKIDSSGVKGVLNRGQELNAKEREKIVEKELSFFMGSRGRGKVGNGNGAADAIAGGGAATPIAGLHKNNSAHKIVKNADVSVLLGSKGRGGEEKWKRETGNWSVYEYPDGRDKDEVGKPQPLKNQRYTKKCAQYMPSSVTF